MKIRREVLSVPSWLIFASTIAFVPPSAAEEGLDVEGIASCMFENSTKSDFDSFKNLVIAALEEQYDQIKGLSLIFSANAIRLVTVDCKQPVATLADPKFINLMESYGMKVTDKLLVSVLRNIE